MRYKIRAKVSQDDKVIFEALDGEVESFMSGTIEAWRGHFRLASGHALPSGVYRVECTNGQTGNITVTAAGGSTYDESGAGRANFTVKGLLSHPDQAQPRT